MDYGLKLTRSPRSPKSNRDRLSPSSRLTPRRLAADSSASKSTLKAVQVLFPPNPGSYTSFEASCRSIQTPNVTFQPPRNKSAKQRSLHQKPYRVLDTSAYSVPSDFYYHPLDWSSKGFVALMLDQVLHFVYSKTLQLRKSACPVDDTIALRFSGDGASLAVGSSLGPVRLIDFEKDEVVKVWGFDNTCFCVDVSKKHIVSAHDSGVVGVCDIRDAAPVTQIRAHEGLACAVVFDLSGDRFASTGASCASVWDMRKLDDPVCSFRGHCSEVRGISFSPTAKNRIATAGGTRDKHVKIWDCEDGHEIAAANVGSQICNLFWNGEKNEIITTEGFHDRTITFWDASELKVVGSIAGHQDRVLYCAMSPTMMNAVTLTAKDGLQFWNFYPDPGSNEERASLR